MNDLVSIIMPSYNTAEYIVDSINSVIKQTYENWELIIVDDCSTDNTDEIVQQFLKDTRIHYLKNEKNCGAAITRNRALREAKGRYIAFLDSDDLWAKEKLSEQLSFMKKNGYSFSFTDYLIQFNGVWDSFIITGPNIVNKRKLYNYCYFSTITVMYDVKVIGLIQIADIRKNNDYAMWFKAIERADCYRLPKCLSFYIKHDNSISSGNKLKLIKYHYLMFRKALNKGKLLSCILTINNLIHGVVKKIIYRKYLKGNELENIVSQNL